MDKYIIDGTVGKTLPQTNKKQVVIKNYSSNTEGIVLETNIPAYLKSDKQKRKSQKTFLSWDKIGSLVFEDYVELNSVDELRSQKQSLSGQKAKLTLGDGTELNVTID